MGDMQYIYIYICALIHKQYQYAVCGRICVAVLSVDQPACVHSRKCLIVELEYSTLRVQSPSARVGIDIGWLELPKGRGGGGVAFWYSHSRNVIMLLIETFNNIGSAAV